ncbi:MAG: hypothetical protein IAI50_20335 [Candidatus Eremiobacteraeota bacterium]|nr:hypothetical protein [Candidatus Eremiobacteraeota bacterium]
MSVGLSTHDAFVRALDRASSIELCSYMLAAGNEVMQALERAADRGAKVSVALEGSPHPDTSGSGLARANRRAADEMRGHGIAVRLAGETDEHLHAKAAIVDGVAFLDDRNWPGDGADTIVVTTERTDVAAIASAIAGRPASAASLATEKVAALRLEADAIVGARGDRIDVESESFGGCSVSKALRDRAASGTPVRLLLSAAAFDRATARERSEIAHLSAAGVEVRFGRSDEKLCVAGDRGWVGSANATYSPNPTLEWGMATTDDCVLASLERSFEREWIRARPAPETPSSQPSLRTEEGGAR